ncbi:MAG TPA: DUF6084 family protein [Acidobacteriaceae bacterium]|jgi:hypothetical protein|nr:DUF6084 family protein [Acidobacteriaceae bacterium]
MPDLTFRAEGAAPAPSAAVPSVVVRLHISNADPQESIRSIGLNCQARILPLGRSYSAVEEARLLELFGERERWARTMTPLVWTSLSVNVPAFTAQTTVELPMPCTLDFDVAATKYFYGLETGSVDVSLVFSGTVFFTNPAGALQIAQIPWDREARFPLPVRVWQEAIAAHYGDSAWLRLPKECMDRLYRYRVARGIPDWDRLLHQLLDQAELAELRPTGEVVR